jgi:hypothetical protein
MPNYRIYRLKETARPHFRAAPHVSGTASVKRKDYEEDGSVDAPHEYAAWTQMRDSPQGIQVGDLLETDNGELRICKYVGFDVAQWVIPAELPAIPAGEELRYTSAEPTGGE